MTYKPPLHIHILFHPRSEQARKLAEGIASRFIGEPASRSLRVPVFLTPDRCDDCPPKLEPDTQTVHDPDWLDLNAAHHSIVIVLADARMHRRIEGGTGKQWAAFTQNLIEKHDAQQHALLLVALDEQGIQLDEDISSRNFITFNNEDYADRREEITFQAAIRALVLLRNQPQRQGAVPGKPQLDAPVTIFLSHAKRDLDENRQGPVHRVLEEVASMRVHHWYDAQSIEATEEFTPAIKRGIKEADLMIVFLTDSWAQSVWCRMEAAYAKEVSTPILVVDALKDGEPRSFPYGGNVRVIRWKIPDDDSLRRILGEDLAADELLERTRSLRPKAARTLLSAAIIETLTRAHHVCLMNGQAKENDITLAESPEAVHLAAHPDQCSFLYPDPPLTSEEHELLSKLRSQASFETPLIRMSKRLNTKETLTIAVSVSDSEMLAEYGLTPLHLRTLTDEIHLYLLVAGLRIAYGGKLEPNDLTAPDNFTLRLFNLVSGYKNMAKTFGANIAPILNVAPWPLWHLYDDTVLSKFGTIAELEKVQCPELDLSEDELQPLPNGFVIPNTIPHQYAWGRALTLMRRKLTDETFARVVVGGKIEGFKGRCAGLIEESLLSLRARKPLFLIGSLGGCARLVIDLLEQRHREEMTTEHARAHVEHYDELEAFYASKNRKLLSREKIAKEIREHGKHGPAQALCNGLNDQQNRELFYCTEPRRIAELIIIGISGLVEA